MSDAVTLRSSAPSIPTDIRVISNEDPSKEVNLVGGLISIAYFESLLSDTLRATVIFVDSGFNTSDKIKTSAVEGLPIVGQEKVILKFEDNNNVFLGKTP